MEYYDKKIEEIEKMGYENFILNFINKEKKETIKLLFNINSKSYENFFVIRTITTNRITYLKSWQEFTFSTLKYEYYLLYAHFYVKIYSID